MSSNQCGDHPSFACQCCGPARRKRRAARGSRGGAAAAEHNDHRRSSCAHDSRTTDDRHCCCIGLIAKKANNEALADAVTEVLPHFAAKDGIVAIGEIGYDEQTALEEKYLRAQIEFGRS